MKSRGPVDETDADEPDIDGSRWFNNMRSKVAAAAWLVIIVGVFITYVFYPTHVIRFRTGTFHERMVHHLEHVANHCLSVSDVVSTGLEVIDESGYRFIEYDPNLPDTDPMFIHHYRFSGEFYGGRVLRGPKLIIINRGLQWHFGVFNVYSRGLGKLLVHEVAHVAATQVADAKVDDGSAADGRGACMDLEEYPNAWLQFEDNLAEEVMACMAEQSALRCTKPIFTESPYGEPLSPGKCVDRYIWRCFYRAYGMSFPDVKRRLDPDEARELEACVEDLRRSPRIQQRAGRMLRSYSGGNAN